MQEADDSPVRIIDLSRGSGGFGFTLSSQAPCILRCIVSGSPAHKVGLKPGDQIIEVNGESVENAPHEVVVKSIARSRNGAVRLGVRSPTDTRKEKTSVGHHNTEEASINANILNRVDKVVEELKSGQLFMDSPTLRQSFSNGQVISEEEIVSDEELKASFSESIRSESSTQSCSPAQSYRTSRRSSEGDVNSALSTPKLSRVLYPVLTPIKPAMNSAGQNINPEIRSVVGYLGSIELPASSSLPTASSNAIRNSVRRLRAQQKVHVMFVMEVSFIGVRLIDSERRTVVTYPLKSLAFTGLCSDDKRVFGIVTRKNNEPLNRSTRWHNVNTRNDGAESTINCSCHVFSVDPELSHHEIHENIADKYGIKCTPCDDNMGCVEFPISCSPILRVITGLFKERSGSESGGGSSDGEIHTSFKKGKSNSQSSSHSESDAVANENHSRSGPDRMTAVNQIDMEAHHVRQDDIVVNGTVLTETIPAAQDARSQYYVNLGTMKKGRQGNDRNDSGLGSDSYQISANGGEFQGGIPQYNGSVTNTPVVNVSSFHCRDSSADSEMSMGSCRSSGAGVVECGVVPLTHSSTAVGRVKMASSSLTVSLEVSVFYQIFLFAITSFQFV